MATAVSTAYAPFAVVERIRRDQVNIGLAFYFDSGATADVSARVFRLIFEDSSGIVVLTKEISDFTRPTVNQLLITLSESDKATLTMNRYNFTLFNVTNNRTELTGVFSWVKGKTNSIGLLAAPDIKIVYVQATGMVEVNGLVIQGTLGWSQVPAIVEDGDRLVLQVVDWTGGYGEKPPIGQYIGANGLVNTKAAAKNIRGPVGLKGDSGTITNASKIVISKNLFNKAAVTEGKEVYADGTLPARADDAISEFIAILPSTTYTLSGLTLTANYRNIAIYAADKTTLVGAVQTFAGGTSKTFTTGVGAAFVAFSLKGRTASITTYDTVQLEQASSATSFTAYVAAVQKLSGDPLIASALLAGLPVADPTGDSEIANLRTVKAFGTTLTLDRGVNLFNKSAVITGKEVYSDGTLPARADDAISDYIPVLPNTTYTISGLTNTANFRSIAIYAADKTTLAGAVQTITSGTSKTITTGAGAAYVVFSLKGRTASITTFDTVQFEQSGGATAYKAFAQPIVSKVNNFELSGKQPVTARSTVNLFNKAAVISGKEVYADGTLPARADDAISDYIPVLPNTTYTISGLTNTGTFRYVAVYAADKTTLVGAVQGFNAISKTITTGATAAYVVFSLKGRTASVTTFDTVQFEQASIATTYQPYSILTLPDNYAVSLLAPDARVTSDPTLPNHPIHLKYFQERASSKATAGKKMVLFGDSITETTPEAGGNRDNWPNYIANLGLLSVSNYARSGSCYKDANGLNSWQRISVQIDRAITAGENPDIIVFSCGTNDGVASLGSFTTAMSKATLTDLDRTFLYEALRYAYWKAATQWPNAVLFCGTPLQRADTDTVALSDLFTAIKTMAGRYNVKVMDAQNEAGVVRDFEVVSGAGRYLYDGLHPNVAGRQLLAKYYSARLLAYLSL